MKPLDFYVKWAATAVVMAATLANAFDVYHLVKPLFLIGCLLWIWAGLLWKQPSLWTLNVFCAVVYIIGMYVSG